MTPPSTTYPRFLGVSLSLLHEHHNDIEQRKRENVLSFSYCHQYSDRISCQGIKSENCVRQAPYGCQQNPAQLDFLSKENAICIDSIDTSIKPLQHNPDFYRP